MYICMRVCIPFLLHNVICGKWGINLIIKRPPVRWDVCGEYSNKIQFADSILKNRKAAGSLENGEKKCFPKLCIPRNKGRMN